MCWIWGKRQGGAHGMKSSYDMDLPWSKSSFHKCLWHLCLLEIYQKTTPELGAFFRGKFLTLEVHCNPAEARIMINVK